MIWILDGTFLTELQVRTVETARSAHTFHVRLRYSHTFKRRRVPELINLTPFEATSFPALTREAEDLLLVVVAGRFDLPAPGASIESPRTAEQQRPVPLADEYWGSDDGSSLRTEGQSTPVRPGTDIYLEGHAWAPRGQPAYMGNVALHVGSRSRTALVFGDRTWTRGVGGPSPSAPQRFERIPIRYERCFGGSPGDATAAVTRAAELNPIGVGLFTRGRDAIDAPLPNFEDPDSLIRGLGDHPAPRGFGPIARSWLPRRGFAGTYDAAWVQTRAPLWPTDLDLRFFCAATPGLCAVPHLRGGETVRMVGVHPDGEIAFMLPKLRLQTKHVTRGRPVLTAMVLDAVMLEPDQGSFTLIWRASMRTDLLRCDSVCVRRLQSWE